MSKEEAAAVYVEVDKLKPWIKNPRRNDPAVPIAAASIKRFGFGAPMVARQANGEIIAGHTRLKAAMSLGMKRVPVRYLDLTESEAHAYALADNKTAEFSEWDEVLLPDVFAELGESALGIGWEQEEIASFMNGGGGAPIIEDDPPPLPAKAITKPGDVWVLGRHQIRCGDSRDEAAWKGRALRMIWTDPPYGVNYAGGMKKRDQIKNDDGIEGVLQLLGEVYPLLLAATEPGSGWYVASSSYAELQILLKRFEIYRQTVIWDKGSFALGRSDYRYDYEPIHYGWTPGATHRWYGGRNKATLLRFPRPARSDDHPTMKPVGLVAHCMENSSKRDDLVGDPFLGSGTTLIAAEQLGRSAYGTELEPRYIDVIVQRWEKLTGSKAERQSGSPSGKGRKRATPKKD